MHWHVKYLGKMIGYGDGSDLKTCALASAEYARAHALSIGLHPGSLRPGARDFWDWEADGYTTETIGDNPLQNRVAVMADLNLLGKKR